jgi:hypothetical protein
MSWEFKKKKNKKLPPPAQTPTSSFRKVEMKWGKKSKRV